MKNIQNDKASYQVAALMSKCLEAIRKNYAGEKKRIDEIRLSFPFRYDDYLKLFVESASCVLSNRRESSSFVVDKWNEPFLQQLYLYLTLNKQFNGDLHKGIMLLGKFGCGKTLIMQALMGMYNTVIQTLYIQRPLLKLYKAIELQDELEEKSVQQYAKLPLIIDDFGREPKQIMVFGNLRSPLIELLSTRYDNAAWTHGTSNFTLDVLSSEKFYGKMLGDRFISMFNFIELKGDSRRK